MLKYIIPVVLRSMTNGFPLFFYILGFLVLINALTGHLPYLLDKLKTDPAIGISFIIGLILGITIHEFAHALVAYRLGDPTAKLAGRLTLNPQAHLDPIGTIAILLVGFGWGKPTPFDPFNLRNIKRDSALISAAGAASNFLVAVTLSVPYLLAFYTHNLSPTFVTAYQYISAIIFVNLLLAVFNLIPVHPLDGFKVLAGLLPKDWYYDFIQMEKFGIIILMILLFSNILSGIIFNITSPVFGFLLPGLAARF